MTEWVNVKCKLPKRDEPLHLKLSDGSEIDGYMDGGGKRFYRYSDDYDVSKKVVEWSYTERIKSRFQDNEMFSEIEKFNISESFDW